ncbi:MAG: hypothetical protein RLY58_95 [Pseudomonadota bacterium]|jgi:hypothetical protein
MIRLASGAVFDISIDPALTNPSISRLRLLAMIETAKKQAIHWHASCDDFWASLTHDGTIFVLMRLTAVVLAANIQSTDDSLMTHASTPCKPRARPRSWL